MKLEAKTAVLPRAANPQGLTVAGKPERMAWLVLFAAFGICIGLTLLVPFLGFQFVRFSTESQTALVQAISDRADGVSAVRVTVPNAALPIAIKDPVPISENNTIFTDNNTSSGALAVFFDSSNAQVSPNSQLRLVEMRKPRFSWSELPNIVTVEQTSGTVRYAIVSTWKYPGNPDGRPTQFLVHTPQFDAWLDPGGSYSVIVGDKSSEIAVRTGSATIQSRDLSRQLRVGPGEREIAEQGKPLADLIPAAQELLGNGDFAETVTCDPNEVGPWRCYVDQGGDGGNINGSIGMVTLDNRRALQIERQNSQQNSAITGIRQTVDRDVSDYLSLKLSASIRIENQNLSGGGYQSTEYPLILRVRYKDVNGDEAEYVRGYYIQNDTNNPILNGELITPNQWITVESSNLLALPIKPFRIVAVEIYASGWDYKSYVADVQLVGE